VERLHIDEGSTIELGQVLLVADGEKVTVGTPTVVGAKVIAEVLGEGKGKKVRRVAIPQTLTTRLKAFCFDRGMGMKETIFGIKRLRAWMIVKEAAERAGITKSVHPHTFRHSAAISRLRITGNPKALQLHLGHSSMGMTMRYLSTLAEEDALRIESEVKYAR